MGGAGGASSVLGAPDPDNPGGNGSSATPADGNKLDTPGYQKQLSKQYQGHADLVDLRTPDAMAEAVISGKKLLSQSVRLPDENSSDEDRARFDARMAKFNGLPETQDGYSFDSVEMPKGYTPESRDVQIFQKYAFDNKLSVPQAQALYAQSAQHAVNMQNFIINTRVTEQIEGDKQLKLEWSGKYDEKVERANRALNHYGLKYPDMMKRLVDSGMAHDPDMRRLFSDIGEDITEKLSPRSTGSTRTEQSKGKDSRFSKLDEYEQMGSLSN